MIMRIYNRFRKEEGFRGKRDVRGEDVSRKEDDSRGDVSGGYFGKDESQRNSKGAFVGTGKTPVSSGI